MKNFSAFMPSLILIGLFSLAGQAHDVASTPAPQVLIVTPLDQQTLAADEINVELLATGIEIQKADGQHVEGIGHFHLYLGDHPMEVRPGEPLGPGWVHTAEMEHTFKDVPPGRYVLTVVLADGRHIPFEPSVQAVVHFTVEAAAPQEDGKQQLKPGHRMDEAKDKNEEMRAMHRRHMITLAVLVALAALVYFFVLQK